MIDRLELHNFKAFSRFTVTFGKQSFLVGPNNAGKSTIIAALRACSNMLRQARRVSADRSASVEVGEAPAYSFSSAGVQLVEENLRHEFRRVETRLRLRFKGGASVTAVWPVSEDFDDEEDPEPYFMLRSGDGALLRRPGDVRREFPQVSVLPLLSPVEHEERVLTPDHIRGNWRGRLASRHFRNQLLLMDDRATTVDGLTDFEAFKRWAEPWTPAFQIGDLTTRLGPSGRMVDFYCEESGSHSDRELFWAGDGIQVWLQLLMHLFLVRTGEVVVLDEPDLYLHADLQRRLVRLLETMECQTIAASHSPEVLVEASPRAVTWVAKERQRAVRAPEEHLLTQLADSIGSQFNLRLARALRARAVMFVEGDDLRVLRNFARTVGAERLVREAGLVTIPLRGFSNWEHVEPFSWLIGDLLERAVPVYVVLDRDYRTAVQADDVERRLAALDVRCHVWHRKELESYVLDTEGIARISNAPAAYVAQVLGDLCAQERATVFARQLAERVKTEVGPNRHAVTVTEEFQAEFEELWSVTAKRPHLCNAKTLLSGLSGRLQSAGHRQVGARSLSYLMRRNEIPDEMVAVISTAESLADGP